MFLGRNLQRIALRARTKFKISPSEASRYQNKLAPYGEKEILWTTNALKIRMAMKRVELNLTKVELVRPNQIHAVPYKKPQRCGQVLFVKQRNKSV
jgi:hypothetical protein